MISETHNTSHIVYWLFEFVRLFQDIPNTFISDMSIVLLSSAAIAFAGFGSVWDYIDWLFAIITSQNITSARLPKCQIRIDLNHLVKNIANCDAIKLKPNPPNHKQFLVRATCLLIKCASLEKARSILYSILVVTKSKVQGTFIVLSIYFI